jgi:2-polyprenyl-6-hydroxyphenyl methylase/3-demethylubiquinone-9 3-methyltransferase
MSQPTIDNDIYEREAASWWEPDSHLHLLAGMIPCRLRQLDELFPSSLQGLEVLDLGCGGGLFSEALAARGALVTGVDPSPASLEAARQHAQLSDLSISYVRGAGERIPAEDDRFDLVRCCDVLEHVGDLERTIAECARTLRPDGLFFFDTINRTQLSKLLIVGMLQDWPWLGVMPRGLHVWDKFIRPGEIETLMACHGLVSEGMAGMSPGLGVAANLRRLRAVIRLKSGRGGWAELGETLSFERGARLSLNYMGWARRG